MLVECVANVSEGRDESLLTLLDEAAGPTLLDRHSDPDHHRSVFTMAGSAAEVMVATRALARAAVGHLDVRGHVGAHPRMGVLDVVPFVPFRPGEAPPFDVGGLIAMRDEFARWLADELGVPTFVYGPRRSLPELRRRAFTDLAPHYGPPEPHPSAGATAVGVRPVLVAYNVWISSLSAAQIVAPKLRNDRVRTLALAVGDRAQVSCNLIEPYAIGPREFYDAVTALVATHFGPLVRVEGAELVGLLPRAVLGQIPPERWPELGLDDDATIEARLGPMPDDAR